MLALLLWSDGGALTAILVLTADAVAAVTIRVVGLNRFSALQSVPSLESNETTAGGLGGGDPAEDTVAAPTELDPECGAGAVFFGDITLTARGSFKAGGISTTVASLLFLGSGGLGDGEGGGLLGL